MTWQKQDTLYYQLPKRITDTAVGFDLDWTIAYSERHLFPNDETDVKLLPKRKEKLQKLYDAGITLIIFTNQSAKSKATIQKRLRRVAKVLELLQIDMGVFVATGHDQYRKPEIGMYKKFRELCPDTELTHYIGDALGRPNDFDDCDKGFAVNAEIKFDEPEKVFKPIVPKIPQGAKQMIMFIGVPGSGKTSFYKQHLEKNYVHVNQDNLGQWKHVVSATKDALKKDQNICIDRTNPKADQREELAKLARDNGYTIHYFYFLRNGYNWNKKRDDKKPISSVVYYKFFKDLEFPEQYSVVC